MTDRFDPTDEEVDAYQIEAAGEAVAALVPVPALETGFAGLPALLHELEHQQVAERYSRSAALADCPLCARVMGDRHIVCQACWWDAMPLARPESVAADGRRPHEIFRQLHSGLRKLRRERADRAAFYGAAVASRWAAKLQLRQARIAMWSLSGLMSRDVQ